MKIHSSPISEIASITQSEWLLKGTDVSISQIITDSRTVFSSENALFIAIKGEQHDGHLFIRDLYEKGIRNFIISNKNVEYQQLKDSNVLFVDDSIFALQKWATVHRNKFKYPVIAITGSNGKTIVKEWLFQLLREDFSIVRSPKSFNSQLGVPLSILQMEESNNLAIFEAGISKMGEMQRLEEMIRPTHGIFTTITNAHSENFSSEEEKASEKVKLFSNCTEIVFNVDNDRVEKAVNKLSIKEKISVGHQRLASLLIGKVTPFQLGNKVQLTWEEASFELEIPFFDRASIEDAVLCVAMMLQLNYDIKVIKERVARLAAIEMRLEMISGINQCTIINDVYNSDLSSLEISLDLLNQQKQHQTKTVVLSDFAQEKLSPMELYTLVAKLIRHKNIHRFIGIGSVISSYANLFAPNSEFYHSTEEFILNFRENDYQNEAILVKGARKFSLERIIEKFQQKVHETVLEINLNAIAHNLNYYRSLLYPNIKIMAMVKAFSYGSGTYEIANILEYNRADYLAVAYADEGVDLRKNGITLPIMVMNPEKQAFDILVAHELEPEMYSMKILKEFQQFLHQKGIKNYPIHLKLDTGMHRLGFMPNEFSDLISFLKQTEEFNVVSLFSHLAASEDKNFDPFTVEQASHLTEAARKLKKELNQNFLIHLVNSSGINRFPKYHFDMVRLGIGLYGIGSDEKENKKLQFTMRLRTVVSQVKTIAKGETVGYGRKGKAENEMTIAILPIGYADGFSRMLGNGNGKVKINGNWFYVIGNVCMDMIMIDVTGAKVNEGDEAIIFDDQESIKELASAMETISYEVLTSVSPRVKRVYYRE